MQLPLHTARLTLRTLRHDDLAPIVAYRNDPVISEFQDWALPYTEASAQALFDHNAAFDGPTEGEWVQIAVEHDGVLVGDLGVELRRNGTIVTLGYTFAREHHGNGYATEAVAGLVDALVDDGAHRFVASLDPNNVPSMRVLEAVGFTFESQVRKADFIRGEWLDDLRYSMLAEDRVAWRSRPLHEPADVALAEIDSRNHRVYEKLETHHSQKRLVAPVLASFSDALFPPSDDGVQLRPWLRGITADGEPAGFVMIAEAQPEHARPGNHLGEPYLWRLLVDRRFQRRGIGARAVARLCEQLRGEGRTSLLVSWVDGPGSPRPFYERLGFVPTGVIDDGEVQARLIL